jgi:transcriptional regulator with XRE-family HTH domain
MNAAHTLRRARRRARLTQRSLAVRTGVSQPTVARIETGSEVPRVDTLSRLLGACGETIESLPRAGEGVDRSGICELLHLTPAERIATLPDEAAAMDRLLSASRVR